jgi:hypothetical protein
MPFLTPGEPTLSEALVYLWLRSMIPAPALPGMLSISPTGLVRHNADHAGKRVLNLSFVEDDPATAGCLLALFRQASACPTLLPVVTAKTGRYHFPGKSLRDPVTQAEASGLSLGEACACGIRFYALRVDMDRPTTMVDMVALRNELSK